MPRKKQKQKQRRRMSCYPLEFRVRVLQEVIRQQTPVQEVARIYGIGTTTIHNWRNALEKGGEEALVPDASGPSKRAPSDEDARRAPVVRVKRENPELGTRRISDVLERFVRIPTIAISSSDHRDHKQSS